MQRWLRSLGVGLVMVVLAGGSHTTVMAEERVVHFVQVHALTGQAGSYGTRSIHGVELAAKHLNEAGGLTDTCGHTHTIKLPARAMAHSREQPHAEFRKTTEPDRVLARLGR